MAATEQISNIIINFIIAREPLREKIEMLWNVSIVTTNELSLSLSFLFVHLKKVERRDEHGRRRRRRVVCVVRPYFTECDEEIILFFVCRTLTRNVETYV
jgi:hypothetical protein